MNFDEQIVIDPAYLLIHGDVTQVQNCRCPICHNIYIEPKACGNCLNHFCARCINKWHTTKPRQCPLCKNYSEMRAVPILKNLLSRLMFCCPNKQNGCKEHINYDHYVAHSRNCVFESIECSNHACKHSCLRGQMPNHDLICKCKIVNCDWCNFRSSRQDLPEHEEVCPEKIQPCQICRATFKKRQLNAHMEVCPMKKQACKWCKCLQVYKQLRDHESICESRKISCLGCNEVVSLLHFYEHQNKCDEYPLVCNRCSKSICRKDFQRHTLEKCIESINIKFQQQITRLKNENENLHRNINQLTRKQKQYQEVVEVGKCRFSLNKKDPDIFVDKNFAIVREHKKKRRDRYALIDIPLGREPITWKIKTISVKSEWFAVGITEESNVYLTRRYHNIGHFSYLISANGMIYSSHSEQENHMQADFHIEPNEIIQCKYEPANSELKIVNVSKNDEISINLDIPEILKAKYFPCVCLRCGGDSVELINQ